MARGGRSRARRSRAPAGPKNAARFTRAGVFTLASCLDDPVAEALAWTAALKMLGHGLNAKGCKDGGDPVLALAYELKNRLVRIGDLTRLLKWDSEPLKAKVSAKSK